MIANVAEIVARADIVDVIGRRLPLRRRGRDWRCCCPFHKSGQEKHPSFSVTELPPRWRCWSCNQRGGDVIAFLQEFEHLEFGEAIEALATETGVPIRYDHAQGDQAPSARQALILACVAAAAHYHNQLIVLTTARDYARGRGLSADICARWKLGYAHGNAVAESGPDADTLVAAGILSRPADAAARLYDPLAGRLIIPLHDHLGRVVAFTGRCLPSAPATEQDRKYLNTRETPIWRKSDNLFGYHAAASLVRTRPRPILVLEGQLKVIAAHTALLAAVAPGAATLSERQCALLARLDQEIWLAYDQDTAGVRATVAAARALRALDLRVRVARIVDPATGQPATAKLDPDDLLAQGADIRYVALDLVPWAFEHLATAERGSAEWGRQITHDVATLIADHPDPGVRHAEYDALSALTGIPCLDLRRAYTAPPPAAAPALQPVPNLSPGRYLAAGALQAEIRPDAPNWWAALLGWTEYPETLIAWLQAIAAVRRAAAAAGIPVPSAIAQGAGGCNASQRDALAQWSTVPLPRAVDAEFFAAVDERVRRDARLARIREGRS